MPGEPRTPPHSIEAEQSVLGGLLLDAAAWDSVGDVLTAEDFYRPDHRLIFESIALLAGEGKACDVITVSEQLERSGRLEDAGGLAYVGRLASDTPTAANIRLRDRARRSLAAGRGGQDPASVFQRRGVRANSSIVPSRRCSNRRAGRPRLRARSVRSLLPALIDKIDEWHNNPDAHWRLPLASPISTRRPAACAAGPVIVAGRPSIGKTTLAVNIAEYAAVNPGIRPRGHFSMEMPSEQVITRMLSSIGGVPLAPSGAAKVRRGLGADLRRDDQLSRRRSSSTRRRR